MNATLTQLLAFARRNPLMIVSLAVAVVLGVADYFLWQRQSDIALRHERVRHEGEKLLDSLTGHSRILNQLATVEDALHRIDHNLVVETELAENLGYFYAIETESGARITGLHQLSSQPVTDDKAYRAVPFSLQIAGDFRQVMTFLRALETGPRVLRVRSYSLARRDPRSDAVLGDFTVELLGRP